MWTVTNVTDEVHHIPLAGVTLDPSGTVDVDDLDLAAALAANPAFQVDPPVEVPIDSPELCEDPPGD